MHVLRRSKCRFTAKRSKRVTDEDVGSKEHTIHELKVEKRKERLERVTGYEKCFIRERHTRCICVRCNPTMSISHTLLKNR